MPSRNRTRRTRRTQRVISAVRNHEQTEQKRHRDITEKKKEIQKGTQVLCIYTLSLVWCVYETIKKVNTILNVVEEKMTVLNHSMKTLFECTGHVQDERFHQYIESSRKQHFATCFAKDMPISIDRMKANIMKSSKNLQSMIRQRQHLENRLEKASNYVCGICMVQHAPRGPQRILDKKTKELLCTKRKTFRDIPKQGQTRPLQALTLHPESCECHACKPCTAFPNMCIVSCLQLIEKTPSHKDILCPFCREKICNSIWHTDVSGWASIRDDNFTINAVLLAFLQKHALLKAHN